MDRISNPIAIFPFNELDPVASVEVAAEAAARVAADAGLTAALAAEASTRATADTANASAISSEATARAAALTAEASARASADTAVQTAAEAYSDSALSTALAGLSPAEHPADAQGSGLTHSGVGQTVGGVVLTTNMRVLDTATGVTSGLWVAATGAWTRPVDFQTGSDARGKLVGVDNGGLWLSVATTPVIVGTGSQVWAQIDASVIQAGTGLSKSGTTLSLALTKALIVATGLAAGDVGAAQNLGRQAVSTGATTINATGNFPADISGGNVPFTVTAGLPTGTRIECKIVKVSGTAGSTSMTISLSGGETFNVTGGATVTTPRSGLGQGLIIQNDGGIWTVQSPDTPLGGALNAAQLGADNKIGTPGQGGSQLTDSVGVGSPPSPTWMLVQWTLAEAFTVITATRDANEAITTASVVWPDGATGTFTTDTASTAFPGAIDAYHVTYVYGAGPTTRTITQAAVTRDTGGAVTAQPALTVV